MSEKKTAGAFDIRTVIGVLLGIYGIILLIVAAVEGSPSHGTRQDNLWAGIILLLVGLVMVAWARLRPIVVETKPAEEADSKTPPR